MKKRNKIVLKHCQRIGYVRLIIESSNFIFPYIEVNLSANLRLKKQVSTKISLFSTYYYKIKNGTLNQLDLTNFLLLIYQYIKSLVKPII